MNENYKRYLISFAITFVTSFGLAFFSGIDKLDTFTWSGLAGLAVAAGRTGVKALLEWLVINKDSLTSKK